MNKYRFLFLRRLTQIGILFLYFGANAYGWKALQGNLSSSLIFNTIPLADPYAVLQIFCTGALVSSTALIGAIIITLFYALIAGRGFCAWVCPVNMVTDFASFIRRSLKLDKFEKKVWLKRNLRYYILAISLLVSFASGVAAFELISPIGIITRGIIFGMGMGYAVIISVFLLDLFVMKNAWCGYICPLGASYSLIGNFSLIRVKYNKEKCTECMECIKICPEKQVLNMITKKSAFITNNECINCGRCIEVCEDQALGFDFRLKKKRK